MSQEETGAANVEQLCEKTRKAAFPNFVLFLLPEVSFCFLLPASFTFASPSLSVRDREWASSPVLRVCSFVILRDIEVVTVYNEGAIGGGGSVKCGDLANGPAIILAHQIDVPPILLHTFSHIAPHCARTYTRLPAHIRSIITTSRRRAHVSASSTEPLKEARLNLLVPSSSTYDPFPASAPCTTPHRS